MPNEDATLRDLIDLVARLRAPDGCPWDREQTVASIRPYLIEEAHELADTMDGGPWSEMAPELGDLLFQAAFLTRLAEEAGGFTLADAIISVRDKMIERHPHVFGDEQLPDTDAVRGQWELRKAKKGTGVLDGVPRSLPGLVAAFRIGEKASGVGFDWPSATEVLAKVDEELGEVRAELRGESTDRLAEELGDLLFAVASLARHVSVDPEAALHRANKKFRRRFELVEERVSASGRSWSEHDLERLEGYWQAAKDALADEG